MLRASTLIKSFKCSQFPSGNVLQLSALLRVHRYISTVLQPLDTFPRRHIGPTDLDINAMCQTVGVTSLDNLIEKNIPSNIRIKKQTNLGPAVAESEVLDRLKRIASKNQIFKSYLGMGYTDNITPPVILRNILENPAWYTQYTPYQAEISQGRLESLINYQTMVQDLTGLPISNASLLDEATAAGEAMLVCYSALNRKRNTFYVDEMCHPQVIDVVNTRAQGFGIKVVVGPLSDLSNYDQKQLMGVLVQYPNTQGNIIDYTQLVKDVHANGSLVVCATDLLSLTLLKPPGEFDVDIAVGSAQRFGTPLGFGGPHAGFFACKEEHKRRMPGRLIGVSKDTNGDLAYRLALQTREQHIRREKATSNICTAQALLANINAMYAVYHGPNGLRDIALRVHSFASIFARAVEQLGHSVKYNSFFDTVAVNLNVTTKELLRAAHDAQINVRVIDESSVSVTFDETCTRFDLIQLISVFADASFVKSYKSGIQNLSLESKPNPDLIATELGLDVVSSALNIPKHLHRSSKYLSHPVFNSYHSETEMLRYMMHLQSKDLSLAHAMIPLGSCTMKLNATTEMIPVTWPEFSKIHPFAPVEQVKGYQIMLQELEYALCEATGFDSVSLQPNSGAQGEYTGLRVIQAYLGSIGQGHRNVCLIPISAHGQFYKLFILISELIQHLLQCVV